MKQINTIKKTILKNNYRHDIICSIGDCYLTLLNNKFNLINIEEAYEVYTVTEYNKPKLIESIDVIIDEAELCIHQNNKFKYYKIIKAGNYNELEKVKEEDMNSMIIHFACEKLKRSRRQQNV